MAWNKLLHESDPTASTQFASLNVTSGVVLADGATVGQTNGPLLTFDDTNNKLILGGAAEFGVQRGAGQGNVAFNISSKASSTLGVDRGNTSSFGAYVFRTNTVDKWIVGMSYDGTDDFRFDYWTGSVWKTFVKLSTAGTYLQETGTPPSSSPADCFQMYSNDIVAGNAAPHFRTELGNIIKLYQQTFITSPAAEVAALKTAVDAIRTLLINNGLMASS